MIYFYKSLDSTNNKAKQLAKLNKSEFSCIVASTQTAGKGTNGRVWVSKPGNLLASIILYPNISAQACSNITLLVGKAIQKVFDNEYDFKSNIKLPNDILVDDKKIVGILCESTSDKNNNIASLIIGIGINTNILPAGNGINANSLANITDKKINNTWLLSKILTQLKVEYTKFRKAYE